MIRGMWGTLFVLAVILLAWTAFLELLAHLIERFPQ